MFLSSPVRAPGGNSGFLKQFIKSLDAVSLKVFLKFLTGFDVMVLQTISVSFNSVEEIGRTPITHSCGPTLVLPSTYPSYNALADEFTNILREKASGLSILLNTLDNRVVTYSDEICQALYQF